MTPEHTQHLLTKHAALFVHLEHELACGDGWFTLVDVLCERLQAEAMRNRGAMPGILRVKEKCGELRVYVADAANATAETQALLKLARALSLRTCEVCGAPGELVGDTWVRARCPAHASAANAP